jgi:hypothetical protein
MEYLLNFIVTLAENVSVHSGNGIVFTLASGAIFTSDVAESVLSGVRLWRGGIADRFAAIDKLVNVLRVHQPTWIMPGNLLTVLISNRNRLQELINKNFAASRADREQRDSLLKSTVDICLMQVKTWAHSEFEAGALTAEDVHQLGFLVPGETGHRRRTKASSTTTEENEGDFDGLLDKAELRRMEIEHLKACLAAAKK